VEQFLYSVVLANDDTRTLPVAVYGFLSFGGFNWGALTAAATIITLPVMLLALVIQRHIISGLSFGLSKARALCRRRCCHANVLYNLEMHQQSTPIMSRPIHFNSEYRVQASNNTGDCNAKESASRDLDCRDVTRGSALFAANDPEGRSARWCGGWCRSVGGSGCVLVIWRATWFTWDDYEPKPFVEQFTKDTGINLKLEIFTGNEDALNKMRASRGQGYDLVTPVLLG